LNGDEFKVHGFDIADNCLDPFFDNIKSEILTTGCLWKKEDMTDRYDAVICTDVLEHIPTHHVPQVLENLRESATRFIFLGIALFHDNFGDSLVGEPLHLTVESPDWWTSQLSAAGYKNMHTFIENNPKTGEGIWLFVSSAITE